MIQILIKRIHYKCQTGCRRYITKVHQECKKSVPRLFFFCFQGKYLKILLSTHTQNSEKSSLKLISHERKTYIISKVKKLVKPFQIRAKYTTSKLNMYINLTYPWRRTPSSNFTIIKTIVVMFF